MEPKGAVRQCTYRYRKDGSFIFFSFLPSIILFWQFNQFCRLCNYLNRKPPGPSRPPCRCSWRVTLLLMEHFFHPHPKVAAVGCRVGHCWATWDSLPSQVWTCRLVHGNQAPGKAVSRLHPPTSCLSASWEKTLARLAACTEQGGFALRNLLQASSKEPKSCLYNGTPSVRTVEIKAVTLNDFFNPVMEKMLSS